MTVWVLIALIHDFGFSRSTTGVFQMEFKDRITCEKAIHVIITGHPDVRSTRCVEFKK